MFILFDLYDMLTPDLFALPSSLLVNFMTPTTVPTRDLTSKNVNCVGRFKDVDNEKQWPHFLAHPVLHRLGMHLMSTPIV